MICAVQTFVNCCTPAQQQQRQRQRSLRRRASLTMFFNASSSSSSLCCSFVVCFFSLALSIEANYCNAIKLRTDHCAKLQLLLLLLLLLQLISFITHSYDNQRHTDTHTRKLIHDFMNLHNSIAICDRHKMRAN